MPEAVASSSSGSSPAPHVGAGAAVPLAKPPAKVEEAPKVEAKEGEAPKEEPKPKPTHKFKSNGKDVEVPLEELEKHYGTLQASHARLKEAAETKKAADADKGKILAALKNGEIGTLKEAGLSDSEIDALAVKHLSAKQQALLEEERIRQLSPELQELERLRKEKADWDKRGEADKQKEKDRVHAEEVAQEEKRIASNVIATLEEVPEKYRRHDFIAQRVMDAWEYFENNKEALAKKGFDVEQVSPKFIAGKVRKEMAAIARLMAEEAKDEELDELIPDSIAGRVLQRRQAKAMKEAHPAQNAEPKIRGSTEEDEKSPAITTAALMRRAYFGGGK